MTQRFVLIGHPVGHSISPAIHTRAYGLLGVDAKYGLADCPTEADVRRVIEEIRAGRIDGANVTVPWKEVAYDLADIRHETARDVGVANVLGRDRDGNVVAYNTDASALGAELRKVVQESGVDQTERPAALVLGSGGAALAAIVACQLAGISEVLVTARRYDVDLPRAEWPHVQEAERLGGRAVPWFGSLEARAALARTHLIVQATSAGMKGAPGGEQLAMLVPWSTLPSLAVYDLVYVPRSTPFLREAQGAGHFARGGLGMLVGQAQGAIGIWLGKTPALEDLLECAEEALGR